MRKALRTLRSRVGRAMRDVERQVVQVADSGRTALLEQIASAKRILSQKPKDKNKLYALHAPEVECLAKGKAQAVRIRRESVDHDDPQGRTRSWHAFDAGQSVRRSYAG
jgi:hypothetical protein